MEQDLIKAMCRVKLVDQVSSDALKERVGAAVKIDDTLVHSHLQWYGHVNHQHTNSNISEYVELEIEGMMGKGCSRK